MRRYITFGGLVVLQALIILFLAWQFQMASTNGIDLTLITKPEDDDMYSYEITDTHYAQFEINFINEDQLEGEATWNDIIYVLLTKENDSYIVKSAHTNEPTAKNEELILRGTYMYQDNETKTHFIEYGFEVISDIDSYGTFKNTDPLQVTFRYADKWNQYKVQEVKMAK